MACKLFGRAFWILLGILFGPGNLPWYRFWRHVSYRILVNVAASFFILVGNRLSLDMGIGGWYTCILTGDLLGLSMKGPHCCTKYL